MADVRHLRVTLRWLQIKDRMEPFFKKKGEFVFSTRVTSAGKVFETRIPERGHWEITDHPRFNTVDNIDKVFFDGTTDGELVIELRGEEIDLFTPNDQLAPYRREFRGDPERWVGRYAPDDEGSNDPENMSNWRICYDIELVAAPR